MLFTTRRSLLASTAPSAATARRHSVWWRTSAPASRWHATIAGSVDKEIANATGPSEATHKKNETAAQKNAREFALLATLLKTFEDATGHRVVPYHFFIPPNDDAIVTRAENKLTQVFGRVSGVDEIPWPKLTRGVNFGRVLEKFGRNEAYQGKHPAVARELNEMGYPLCGSSRRQLAWEQQIMAALKAFYNLHGHTLVPIDFEVPRGDAAWPVATWGYNLGRRVDMLRHSKRDLSDAERADLKRVEFSFNISETMWSDHILASLETYARVHGNCRVPHAFAVPRADPWPRKAWGLSLGQVVTNIRSGGHYVTQVKRDATHLEAIDFVWDDAEYQWSDRVLPSLETFFQVNGHSLVPTSFVVPSESPWPKEAWGLDLGISVSGIRLKDCFTKLTERDAHRLDAIGFVWDVSEHKWSKMILPSLETFARDYGHCDVPHSFVVPRESPWPETAWGWRLGDTVTNMRSSGYYAAQMNRDGRQLDAIKFVWNHREFKWTNQILPSLEVYYEINGHTRIPASFVVPSEAPWSEKMWGLQLGAAVFRIQRQGAYAEFTERDEDRLRAIKFELKQPRRL